MAALSAIQVAEDARKARARIEMVALSMAESNAADIGEAVRSIRGFLAELARRPSVRNLDPAHCDPIFGQEFYELFPQYSNLLTKGLEGRVLCSSRPMAPGTSEARRDTLITAVLRRPWQVGGCYAASHNATVRWISCPSHNSRLARVCFWRSPRQRLGTRTDVAAGDREQE